MLNISHNPLAQSYPGWFWKGRLVPQDWALQNLGTQPLTSYVTLNKWLIFSGSQFPYL